MKYAVVREMPTGLVERLNTVTFLGKFIKAIVGSNLKQIDIHHSCICNFNIFFSLVEDFFVCWIVCTFFSHECLFIVRDLL